MRLSQSCIKQLQKCTTSCNFIGGTVQKMESLKAEPKVGVDVSKSVSVVGPRQSPVEAISKVLMNDDPTEYRLDGNCSWLTGN